MPSPEEKEPAKTTQYEFTNEQNKLIAQLSSGMQWVGTALSVLGYIYLIAVIICVTQALSRPETLFSAVYVLLATLFFLALGIWTRKASRSFQAITKTRGRDMDHLMEALDHLRKHYSLVSTVVKVYVALILVAVIAGIVVTIRKLG